MYNPHFLKNKLKCFREKNVFQQLYKVYHKSPPLSLDQKAKVVETEVISCKKLRLITAKATAYRAFEKRAMTTLLSQP